MSIALSALIIALFSLIWNVATALNSWRANKPSIKIDLRDAFWPRIAIGLRNKGGSPIEVTGIDLIVRYIRKLNDPPNSRRRRRWDLSIPDYKNDMLGASGPQFPFTIAGYHSERWDLNKSFADEFWKTAFRDAKEVKIKRVSIRVHLATGKKVKKRFSGPLRSHVKPPKDRGQPISA